MKRTALLLLLLVFVGHVVKAQNQANIWYFGKYSGLDFSSGEPVFMHDIPYFSMNANASICDSSGNLLFACNSEKIWNRNGQIMQNGSGLLGGQYSSQGALIVQKPGFIHLYYVFTVAWGSQPIGLHYSVVNMNLDEGLGAVTEEKNVSLDIAWDAMEKMTAVRHTNGKDIWVITRKFREDNYAAFLLTSSGINNEPVLSTAIDRSTHSVEGTMKISPNKKYLAAAYWEESAPNKQTIEICRFNAQTGRVEFLYSISRYGGGGQYLNEPFAVEFSPDSKLLYATYHKEADGIMELYQYDMQFVEDSVQFKQSEVFIASGPVNGCIVLI